jgi:hypothetical protein
MHFGTLLVSKGLPLHSRRIQKEITMQFFPKLTAIIFTLAFFGLGATRGATTNGIAFGQTATGTILLAQTNFYSFSATTNDVVTILLSSGTPVGPPLPTLELQGPGGTVVANASGNIGGNNAAYIDAKRLTNTGTYLILVHDDDGAQTYDYGLTLIKNPGPNPANDGGTIQPGQTVSNSLDKLGAIDVYTFSAASNDVVTILLTSGTPFGPPFPTLELQGPGGTVVANASGNIGGNNAAYIDAMRLTNAGNYLILVRDEDGVDAYDYGLTLIKNPGPNPANDGGTILPGQTVSNSLDKLGAIDVYTFSAASNDVVTILLTSGTPVGPPCPTLELQGPGGTVMANASGNIGGNNAAYIDAKRLTNTGTYLILVRDDDGFDAYDYGLTLIKNPGPNPANDGGTIQPGQTVSNSLDKLGAIDVYTFSASSNDVVTILLTSGTTFGPPFPTLELQGPGGTVVANASGNIGGNNAAYIDAKRLTNTGPYFILVRDNDGFDAYDYGLTLIKNPGPNSADDGGTILPGQTVTNSLNTLADIDVFTFAAIVGDSITLSLKLTTASGLSPTIELHAPNGSLVATSSGPSAATISLCVPQTGNYLVLVRDDAGNDTFGYQLSFSQVPAPIVPPSSGSTQNLAIFQCTNHIFVLWETNAFGFRLESTKSLPSSSETNATWVQESQLPLIVDGHFYFTEPRTNKTKFYRLKCTNCPPALVSP